MKYLMIVIAFVAFTSCKKCYTCTSTSSYVNDNNTTDSTKVTSRQACGMTLNDKQQYEKDHTNTLQLSPWSSQSLIITVTKCE